MLGITSTSWYLLAKTKSGQKSMYRESYSQLKKLKKSGDTKSAN